MSTEAFAAGGGASFDFGDVEFGKIGRSVAVFEIGEEVEEVALVGGPLFGGGDGIPVGVTEDIGKGVGWNERFVLVDRSNRGWGLRHEWIANERYEEEAERSELLAGGEHSVPVCRDLGQDRWTSGVAS